MKQISKNPILALFGVGFIIISLAIAYYFIVALPKSQSDKQMLEALKFQSEQNQKNTTAQKYQACATQAEKEAQDLLKSRIELMRNSGYTPDKVMVEAEKKNMYQKDDYENYYNNCLKSNGLPQK